MSALVRRIRRIILSDVQNKNQELREALDELGIEAGDTVPGSMQKLQRIVLNAGRDSEVQLRRALNGLGVTGGGAGGREVARIRDVILRTGRISELRTAINDLMTEEELLADAPEGFAYLTNADGAFITNADDAFIIISV